MSDTLYALIFFFFIKKKVYSFFFRFIVSLLYLVYRLIIKLMLDWHKVKTMMHSMRIELTINDLLLT